MILEIPKCLWKMFFITRLKKNIRNNNYANVRKSIKMKSNSKHNRQEKNPKKRRTEKVKKSSVLKNTGRKRKLI